MGQIAFGIGMFANQMFPAILGIFMVVLVEDLDFLGGWVTIFSSHDFLMPLPILSWALFQTIPNPNGDAEDNMYLLAAYHGIAYILCGNCLKKIAFNTILVLLYR